LDRDFLNEIWLQFETEAMEHCTSSEDLLLDTNLNANEGTKIDSLFRAFHSLKDAGEAVGNVIGSGIVPAGLEMMDKKITVAVEDFVKAGYPVEAEAILLCESDGTSEEVNDEINMSQSSNDTFPTATNIAVTKLICEKLIPSTESFIKILNKKVKEFSNDIKIGRTHMMDATPISLGQEFSGYESQMKHGLKALKNTLKHLKQLAIGGTAVGTGLNAPDGFDVSVVKNISDYTKINFEIAENKFESIASNDALVETHGALKQIAVSLFKIANDIRLLGSGPRSGFAELILPANEPGSSIMPGKVNPTQCEAVSMVCTQVLGNDTTVSFAGSQGHLELNVYKPVIAHKLIESIHLLSDSMESFNKNCLVGLKANKTKIAEHLNNSLMLVTALNKKIGYYKAAEIANKAHENGTTLEEEAIRSGYLTKKQFKDWVNPEDMV